MVYELDRFKLYQYKLDRILGRGGTGTVYRGLNQENGQVVAIKLFHQNFFRSKTHVKDLGKAAMRFQKFEHPNVVRVFDFLNGDDGVCLVQEYVDGPDLKWYIANRPWSLPERLVIVAQICNGLQYIHDQGFTHHDLKPANVLFTRKGQVKLVDYSLNPTRFFGLLDGGLSEQVTPMYVAPDILKKHKATPQSDMYSLGVTMYLMFCGQLPFQVDNLNRLYYCHLNVKPEHPSTINRKCPHTLGNIIMKLLNKDPKDRYDSCDQLRIVLSNEGRSRI